MDGYSTEDEQVELLKKWWADNGKSAIFGVILGLAAIFGWRQWQSHKLDQTEAASEIYQAALVASSQDNNVEAKSKASQIVESYGESGYAVFARLMLASIAVEESDYNAAEQYLSDALTNIDNESLKHEVTLRQARVHIANNKAEQALGLLNKTEYGAFTPVYNELKGDAYAALSKPDEARQAWQQAVSDLQGTGGDVTLLNLKIDALGQD